MWCRARIADYKVPETITWTDAPLPRNARTWAWLVVAIVIVLSGLSIGARADALVDEAALTDARAAFGHVIHQL